MPTSRFELFSFPSAQFFNWLHSSLPASATPADQDLAFQSILTLLENRLGATFVLCEKEYIDVDYQSLSASWYSKSFKPLPSRCCRLHFFAGTSAQISLDAIQRGAIASELYFGYVILTPLNTGRVGRTVLAPWQDSLALASGDALPRVMVAPSAAHVFGTSLKAKGAPYLSQDAMVMVCAQSAVWMAVNFLHNRYTNYGNKRIVPDEITKAATEYLRWGGRILPSGGLTLEHIANALSNLGYSPIVDTQQSSSEWEPLNWIQKYVSSDIPVILALHNPPHAIVAVGSLCSQKRRTTPRTGEGVISIDHWTRAIIVNDDNLGPYKLMAAETPDAMEFQSRYCDLAPPDYTWKSIDDISALFVPLPAEVSLQARHIDSLVSEQVLTDDPANSLITRFVAEAGNDESLEYFLAACFRIHPDERIVTRSYLMRSMEFLAQIRGLYPTGIQRYYDSQQFPEFIWVVELYFATELDSNEPDKRKLCGEIIFDSTANRYDPCWLFVHILGHIVKRQVLTEQFEYNHVPGITSYRSPRP